VGLRDLLPNRGGSREGTLVCQRVCGETFWASSSTRGSSRLACIYMYQTSCLSSPTDRTGPCTSWAYGACRLPPLGPGGCANLPTLRLRRRHSSKPRTRVRLSDLVPDLRLPRQVPAPWGFLFLVMGRIVRAEGGGDGSALVGGDDAPVRRGTPMGLRDTLHRRGCPLSKGFQGWKSLKPPLPRKAPAPLVHTGALPSTILFRFSRRVAGPRGLRCLLSAEGGEKV
jgi:hypothetical protein